LYITIKLRPQEELDVLSDADLAKEKAKLKSIMPLQLIEYISQSFEIIINMKNDENPVPP